MVTYRYTARDAAGRKVRGVARAADPQALYTQLRAAGLYLTGQRAGRAGAGRALGPDALSGFCRGLGMLIASGMPLLRALDILAQESGLPAAQRALYRRLSEDLREGTPLSAAMENNSPAFPSLLAAAVRSAEGNGRLHEVCLRMAAYYEKEHRTARQVQGSLLYPAVLAVLVVAVTGVLVGFVLPQFAELFAGLESLPWPTRLLFALCAAARAGWYWLVLAAALLALAARLALHAPGLRRRWDRLRLRVPFAGGLYRKICTARFARTLAGLYACGVPVLYSLQAACDTVRNAWIAGQFPQVLAAVRSGGTLSAALQGVDGFESKLAAALQVGEETGRLDAMMNGISDTLDYEADQAAKQLLGLLEPLMIVVMGAVVALVVTAVILPLYSAYGTITV